MDSTFIKGGKSDHVVKNGFCLFWKSWLSNWTTSPMMIDNVRYTCVEQYMMSCKARLFGDHATLKQIMATTVPKEQKGFGRSVVNFNEKVWLEVAFDVVLRGTIEKYRQNPSLLIKLEQLGDVEFVEASPIDKVWGIGLGVDDPDAADKSKWLGQNLLGKAIDAAKEKIEKLESAGVSVGGGADLIWKPGVSDRFLIGLDQVE